MEHSSVSAEQFKDADTRHDAMLPIIGCGNSPPLVEPLRLPKLADMLLWDPHHQFDEKRGECRRNPEPLANHVPLHVFPQRTVSDDVYTEALLLGLLSESFNGVGVQMESEGLRLDSTRSVGRRQNSQSPLKEALRPRGCWSRELGKTFTFKPTLLAKEQEWPAIVGFPLQTSPADTFR